MRKGLLRKKKKAFGLLEVLISGVIIGVVTGVLVFAQRAALANSEYTKEEAAATYLDQQAIEQVRQMRDSNWIDGRDDTQWASFAWDSANTKFTNLNLASPQRCGISEESTTKRLYLNCSATAADSFNIDGVTYTRTVTIEKANANLFNDINGTVNGFTNAIKVTAGIAWPTKKFSGQLKVSEALTNWRPDF